jgi:hypothetical protein
MINKLGSEIHPNIIKVFVSIDPEIDELAHKLELSARELN